MLLDGTVFRLQLQSSQWNTSPCHSRHLSCLSLQQLLLRLILIFKMSCHEVHHREKGTDETGARYWVSYRAQGNINQTRNTEMNVGGHNETCKVAAAAASAGHAKMCFECTRDLKRRADIAGSLHRLEVKIN